MIGWTGFQQKSGYARAFVVSSFPRFREVTVSDTVPEIVVRTRTGGGNREEYTEEHYRLFELDGYIDNDDDSDDCTYAYFRYRIPERSRPAWQDFVKREYQ